MLPLGRFRAPALLATGAMLVAACGTTDVPEPAPPAGEADYAIISNPTTALEGAPPSGGISSSGRAYVSVLPGTFSAAVRIVIRNHRTDDLIEVGTTGGGLDPVSVLASAGDELGFTVLSADGSAISFARAVPARKRPRVIRFNPPKGRTDVAINASVVVVFSEPVDPATVGDATIHLESQAGAAVPGTVSVASDGLSATFIPGQELEPDTEYRIEVTGDVRDRDGSPVEEQLASSFRTQGVPTAPTPIPPGLTSNVIAFRNYFGGIMLISGEGGPAVSIFGTSDQDDEPSWSPDGRSLVLSRGRYLGAGALKVLSTDGSGSIRDLGEGVDPAWSPDGSRIAFTSSRSGSSEIYVVNPDGTGTVRLTQNPGGDDGSPAWSPDGRQIVFVREGEITVMNADGSEARSLGQTGGAPAWSPDGTRIAFDRLLSADWRWDIWVMNADGSAARNVTNNAPLTTSYGPTWSPDSRRIAFAHARTEEDPYQIYVINADGTGMMHLGPDQPGRGLISASYAPAWSPR